MIAPRDCRSCSLVVVILASREHTPVCFFSDVNQQLDGAHLSSSMTSAGKCLVKTAKTGASWGKLEKRPPHLASSMPLLPASRRSATRQIWNCRIPPKSVSLGGLLAAGHNFSFYSQHFTASRVDRWWPFFPALLMLLGRSCSSCSSSCSLLLLLLSVCTFPSALFPLLLLLHLLLRRLRLACPLASPGAGSGENDLDFLPLLVLLPTTFSSSSSSSSYAAAAVRFSLSLVLLCPTDRCVPPTSRRLFRSPARASDRLTFPRARKNEFL